MSPRGIALTAAAAVLLAAAAALMSRLQKPAEPGRPLAKLRAGDVARIELDRAGERVVLESAAGRWRLAAPVEDEADGAAAEELSRGLLALSLGSEVSRDPAGYDDYELNESSAVRVRVYSRGGAAPVLDGSFGKEAMAGSLYYRAGREAAVHLAEGPAPELLRRGCDELRSKSLLPVPVGELEVLRFSTPGGFTLHKSTAGWSAAGRKLSADKAAELVLALSSLRFTSFLPALTSPKTTGLGKPALDLVASGGGRSERILLGKEDAGRRYASCESRKALGFVPKYDADSLLKLLRP